MLRRRNLNLFTILFIILLSDRLIAEDDSIDDEIDDNGNTEEAEESGPDENEDPSNDGEEEFATPTRITSSTTRMYPLECYVCVYKSDIPLWACLDPVQHNVIVATCPNVEDKCFTTFVNYNHSGNYVENIVRNCRTGCVNSTDTTCCSVSRCNDEAFHRPERKSLIQTLSMQNTISGTTKVLTPTMLYFVTILLILQTIARVAFF